MFEDFYDDYNEIGAFDKKEKDKVLRVGNRIAENHVNDNRGSTFKYGLCHDCTNFEFIKTLYEKEFVACDSSRVIKPSCVDPIKQCSNFYPKGQLNLNNMFAIAYEINDNKKEIGFKLVQHKEEENEDGNE